MANATLTTTQKVSLTFGQLPIPFLVYGGKTLDKPIRYTLEVTSTKPFELTIFYHSSRNKQDETINKKTEVMKIKAGIGYLKPDFDVIPLEDKLVFSSMVDDKPYAFNFHYEVIKNLALPYWIDNAEQYVSLNELAPIWLVIAKLWLKASVNDQGIDDKGIEETLEAKQFTELEWWESLIEAANILPTCVQLRNGLKTIPEQYQYLLNPAIDIEPSEDVPNSDGTSPVNENDNKQ